MSTLYIDKSGTQLKFKNGALQILNNDAGSSRTIPIKYIDRIVMRSDTVLSSQLLCSLSDQGVGILAIGGRSGQQIAEMIGVPHNNAKLRWQQVIALSKPSYCAQIAKTIIYAKVRRQLGTLQEMSNLRPDLRKPLHDAMRAVNTVLEALNERDGAALDSLRGLEGAAAAAYFSGYFNGFAPALGANGRNRRPPKDPVNAVLSLSYTLLSAQATSACWAAGLDPALGALHQISHGRPALACDLMEPFRPQIDLWVWGLFKKGELRVEHFGHDGANACLLGKAGRGYFYAAWEQTAEKRQKSLLRYARMLAIGFSSESPESIWSHLEDSGQSSLIEFG